MAQPEQAAGEVGNPADSNPATPFEDIAAEMLGEDTPEEEEQPAEPVEDEGEQPEAEVEDEAADEEDDEPALPAIDPPNSLTAEEKEAFKSLPREAQEFTARRIGELEKGFQTKAQEAAQAKQAAQLEALQVAEQIKAQAAEQLQRYAEMFEVKPPSAALLRQDPDAYAQQLESYQYYTAQRESAQRDADKARAEQTQLSQARAQHEAEAFRQQLEAELPEIFDPATGQQLAQELNATAELLGFDPNEISDVSAIKALKVTSEWKTKADKYDAMMKRKMERVREGKNPPPISKPGTARMPEQNRKARADQAWQTAVTAKSRPQRDEALATWAEQAGFLD
jgi:hypothetical protein